MNKRREALCQWALLVFVSAVCLIGLELGLRSFTIFPIHGFSSNRIRHARLIYVVDPNLNDVDANGFRNQTALKKADIVAIGDSHTYGYNVDSKESWPSQVGRLTHALVYNMGIGGYGFFQYREIFDMAMKMSPDWIVVAIYPANDLGDMDDACFLSGYWRQWCRDNGFDAQTMERDSLRRQVRMQYGFLDWLRRDTALCSMVSYYVLGPSRYHSLEKKVHLKAVRSGKTDELPLESSEYQVAGRTYVLSDRSLYYNGLRMDFGRPGIVEAFKVSLGILKAMHSQSQMAGVRFGVMIVPSGALVVHPFVADHGRISATYERYAALEEALVGRYAAFLEQEGMPFTNPLSLLREAVSQGLLVYPDGNVGHPMAKGYALYARAVAEMMGKEEHGFARP